MRLPSVLCVLLAQLVWAHTPVPIFRYPGYTGCDTVAGTVTFHSESGVQQMIISFQNLPPNATGYIQIHNGVNCFDSYQIGAIWMGNDADEFPFGANENGTITGTVEYGNVTVDSLMGRSVIVLLQNDTSTSPRRIGCGTVGLSYPATLGAYPGVVQKTQGTVAVTGPLTPTSGSILQLAYTFQGLAPASSGTVQVFSGSSCSSVAQLGTLWGTNWTSGYTADAAGKAIGNADITNVSPARGVQDYMNHAVVISDASNNPLACAVLKCPDGSIEEGQTGGMNMQHGRCVPSQIWVNSSVVAADLYSGQTTPVQVQVSGVGFGLNYGEVRSYPACAPQGSTVGTTFFVQTASNVEGVIAGQFSPTAGSRQVVALGDKQPESVGRQDNRVNVSFIQSTQPNTHDVVNLAVGAGDIIFHVAASGFRRDTRVPFRSNGQIAFPTNANPANTTVWVTNAASGAVLFQKAYVLGKNTPNFVWFVYGWDASSPDCKGGQKNCARTPITVQPWPEMRTDSGPGVIPPIQQYSSSFMCVPSLLILSLLSLF